MPADRQRMIEPPFEAYDGTQPHLFVSYAHRDRAQVFPELARLHSLGYRIWYDEGIEPGNDWPDNVAAALDRCAFFLVFLSPRAVKSKNVINEIYYAIEAEKPFVRVDLEETTLPPGLKLFIGPRQAILRHQMTTDRYERELAAALPPSVRGRPGKGTAAKRAAPASAATTVAKALRVMAPAPAPAPPPPPPVEAPLTPWLTAVPGAALAPLTHLAPGSAEAQQALRQLGTTTRRPLEVRTRQTSLVFRLVPPGNLMMGSPLTEGGHDADERQHLVMLTQPYYCGRFQVTQGQWELVMGANPADFRDGDREAPVENVSWSECRDFLRRLAALEGAPAGTFRLPTEAEWEYACRAGTQAAFCFGDALSSQQANFDGNYPYGGAPKGNCLGHPVAVGRYPPNAFGLHDLHGNVWEWCADWYAPYPPGVVTDPTGPAAGAYRTVRGGCWNGNAGVCRSAFRYRKAPTFRNHCLGLRVVMSVAACVG